MGLQATKLSADSAALPMETPFGASALMVFLMLKVALANAG